MDWGLHVVAFEEDLNPTAPLPILSEFFTWAPGQAPAPSALPHTPTSPPLSPPRADAIDAVPPPGIGKSNVGRPRWMAILGVLPVAVAAAVVLWPDHNHTTLSSPSTPTVDTSTTERPQVDPRLAALMPPGYPNGTCAPAAAANVVVAQADCGPNASAPHTTARFTLYRDASALADALDRLIRDTTVLVCPGNYQSPGPWRHNADLSKPVGTLVCGTSPQGNPRIGWTLDSELLLATIDSDGSTPSLAQLYDWWSQHP